MQFPGDDLLYDVITAELRQRGLKVQAEIAAFVRREVDWKIPQQAISKILHRQIKNPRHSTHVLMLLIALGRTASGKARPAFSVNENFLREAIVGVERGLEGREPLTPEGKADLILSVYRVWANDGQAPSRATILEFARRLK